MIFDSLEIVKTTEKPELTGVAEYFKRRLVENPRPEVGLTYRKDSLGNSVFVSGSKTESGLDCFHPATLVMSDKGQALRRENPELLKSIANPTNLNLKLIGNEREGKAYIIELNIAGKKQQYVVKYNYPTSSTNPFASSYITFTPGIDNMRISQWLSKKPENIPVPDFQIVVPVIASMDMSLTPYIPDVFPMTYLVEKIREILNSSSFLPGKFLNSNNKKMLQEIWEGDIKLPSEDKFMNKFFHYAMIANAGLSEWVTDQYKNGNLPSLTQQAEVHFKELERPDNRLISIPQLHNLWKKYRSNTQINTFSEVEKYMKPLIADGGAPNPIPDSSNVIKIRQQLNNYQKEFLREVEKATYIIEALLCYKMKDK